MGDSAEHLFVSESLDRALTGFSDIRLLGLSEIQRRTFDYGCLLLRDFSRPLVSQVLWSHQEGIDKDIRTLLFDNSASLKVYFVRDKVRNRARIDEVLKSFRDQKETVHLLRGLRVIPVPDEFDADSEEHRRFMDNYLRDQISLDLMFGVVFGKLNSSDVHIFSNHGGPFGLKFTALYFIDKFGLSHGPTFEAQVGSKGSPLREVLTMLNGTGLIASVGHSIQKVPTLKGRFLLDLSRRLAFEWKHLSAWSDELKLIMSHLRLDPPAFNAERDPEESRSNVVLELLNSFGYAKSQYGVDLLEGIDISNPEFYSAFDWRRFTSQEFFGVSGAMWDDFDDIVPFSD